MLAKESTIERTFGESTDQLNDQYINYKLINGRKARQRFAVVVAYGVVPCRLAASCINFVGTFCFSLLGKVILKMGYRGSPKYR
jgi:hypothetical protein